MGTPEQTASRILVVDDNAENRALAQATLEDEGFEVLLAPSGADGIREFQERAPDCVLLDVRMPDLDGFAVCSRIRELPGGPETPIVFLTALRDVDTFDRALRAGGDDFLTKPVRPTELVVRIQAALKLRRMSTELREHYDLVRKQRDDLMRLQLQKERLSAFVVHDLKNPVNSINLGAQVLLASKNLPAPAQETAQHIRSDARTLLRLITNLLDISKSEEGQLQPRLSRVDIAALGRELREAFELAARMGQVELVFELEATSVTADLDLLRRVLENLLENAVRHGPANTQVVLRAQVEQGSIQLSVTDRGAGIPGELRERIFERYVQVEEGERVVNRAGRGLGLTFCKLAVEAHGGTIWVEDANPGSRFCVRLPNED